MNQEEEAMVERLENLFQTRTTELVQRMEAAEQRMSALNRSAHPDMVWMLGGPYEEQL